MVYADKSAWPKKEIELRGLTNIAGGIHGLQPVLGRHELEVRLGKSALDAAPFASEAGLLPVEENAANAAGGASTTNERGLE